MDLELQDRFFVITDAEPGLGETVARALAAEGARVLSSTASNLAGKPAGEFVAQAEAEWGRLDGALVFVPVSLAGSDHEVRDDDWAAAFENSFLHVVDAIRHVSRALSSGGSLVVVFGSAIHESAPGHVVEDALGRGLATLVFQLAEELGPRGVRAIGLLTGLLAGDAERPSRPGEPSESTAARWHIDDIPLRRYGTAQEFARVATFVLSPCSVAHLRNPLASRWGLGPLRLREHRCPSWQPLRYIRRGSLPRSWP